MIIKGQVSRRPSEGPHREGHLQRAMAPIFKLTLISKIPSTDCTGTPKKTVEAFEHMQVLNEAGVRI